MQSGSRLLLRKESEASPRTRSVPSQIIILTSDQFYENFRNIEFIDNLEAKILTAFCRDSNDLGTDFKLKVSLSTGSEQDL